MAIVRISVTLPRDLARAIDAKASELDRSRSWVIAEAARQFVGVPESLSRPAQAARATPQIRESLQPYTVTPGLGESRLRQLEADLKLTPSERVRAAEETARVGDLVGKRSGRTNQILSFETYEDYLDWKRREAVRS